MTRGREQGREGSRTRGREQGREVACLEALGSLARGHADFGEQVEVAAGGAPAAAHLPPLLLLELHPLGLHPLLRAELVVLGRLVTRLVLGDDLAALRLHVLLRHHALAQQLLRVELHRRHVLRDVLVHGGLREKRLVLLVVACGTHITLFKGKPDLKAPFFPRAMYPRPLCSSS